MYANNFERSSLMDHLPGASDDTPVYTKKSKSRAPLHVVFQKLVPAGNDAFTPCRMTAAVNHLPASKGDKVFVAEVQIPLGAFKERPSPADQTVSVRDTNHTDPGGTTGWLGQSANPDKHHCECRQACGC